MPHFASRALMQASRLCRGASRIKLVGPISQHSTIAEVPKPLLNLCVRRGYVSESSSRGAQGSADAAALFETNGGSKGITPPTSEGLESPIAG